MYTVSFSHLTKDMTKTQRKLHFSRRQRTTRRQEQQEEHEHREQMELENHRRYIDNYVLRRQLTSTLSLLSQYYLEVERLRSDLERLSSLPSELNIWYERYATLRDANQRLVDNSELLQDFRERNHALELSLERLQRSWRSLNNQLRQRSIEFNFPIVHYNPWADN